MTSIPKISQLSKSVIRVLGCNPGFYTLQGTNTYIIGSGKNRILLDCGEANNREYITNLKKVVQDNDISLTKIILTHWHPDHIGGTYDVLSQVASKECQVFKFKNDKHDSRLDKIKLNYLIDEDEISVEGASLRVYHTPGHAIDHLVFYLKEEDNLFSGDCILGEGTAIFEDLLDYLKSLKQIASLKPKTIYPGHGPVINDSMKTINEYIEKRLNRENEILKILAESKNKFITIEQLVHRIYPDLPQELLPGAQYNTFNHLDKLMKESLVEKLEDSDNILMYRLKNC